MLRLLLLQAHCLTNRRNRGIHSTQRAPQDVHAIIQIYTKPPYETGPTCILAVAWSRWSAPGPPGCSGRRIACTGVLPALAPATPALAPVCAMQRIVRRFDAETHVALCSSIPCSSVYSTKSSWIDNIMLRRRRKKTPSHGHRHSLASAIHAFAQQLFLTVAP